MRNIDSFFRRVANNFSYEWNFEVKHLLKKINPYVWGLSRNNVYRYLKIQYENPLHFHKRLAELSVDPDYNRLLEKAEREYNDYQNRSETTVQREYPELQSKCVAYFSMEYGIESLRVYSGGLGMLSGDHLRGASDIGINMVGVGFLYRHGYYEQQVGLDGSLKVFYEATVPAKKPVRDYLPLEAVKRSNADEDLIVEVPIANKKIRLKVWRAKIGHVDLLLLDSNLPENGVHDRNLTQRLYASRKSHHEERRHRLAQEILLGVGGMRALYGAGYNPEVVHLNEGHVAFASFELLRYLMTAKDMEFDQARAEAGKMLGFTTHTPVPEGNERFDEALAREYLEVYLDRFLSKAEREKIFDCARNQQNQFDMTKLSLLTCEAFRNGVSQLHGEVCRKMWNFAWANPAQQEAPIGHITNSVHVPYWQRPQVRDLIRDYGGLSRVENIPDEAVWETHLQAKRELIEKVKERVSFQLLRENQPSDVIHKEVNQLMEEDSFIIGFARRFAPYKRVTLLLDDEPRFFSFLENAYHRYGKPVYVLFAGKPHPDSDEGRKKVAQIVEFSDRLKNLTQQKNFKADVIFVQGYDINLARYLVSGVDIWLNNPIRPLEASGTSGMKAGVNGVLNVSIPDGWVPEGIAHGENGWLFGEGREDTAARDREHLFQLLENDILPKFFERSGGHYSHAWTAMMKNSIRTITEKFNTDRMLKEYIEKMYLPALHRQPMTVYK